MGLGKTIQSIGFMACLQEHLNKKGPFLIVVPLSVLSNWISEIERFCPSFRAVRYPGKYRRHKPYQCHFIEYSREYLRLYVARPQERA
jgi:SNF2 family DNA or RNA helicase